MGNFKNKIQNLKISDGSLQGLYLGISLQILSALLYTADLNKHLDQISSSGFDQEFIWIVFFYLFQLQVLVFYILYYFGKNVNVVAEYFTRFFIIFMFICFAVLPLLFFLQKISENFYEQAHVLFEGSSFYEIYEITPIYRKMRFEEALQILNQTQEDFIYLKLYIDPEFYNKFEIFTQMLRDLNLKDVGTNCYENTPCKAQFQKEVLYILEDLGTQIEIPKPSFALVVLCRFLDFIIEGGDLLEKGVLF